MMSSFSSLTQFLARRVAPCSALVLGLPAAALAQGGAVVTTSTPINWMDVGIVVLLFGGALFAVCRSSNRT